MQLTGVWCGGCHPCAYRVFDVDDMLTNTTGALLGSLCALAVPRTWRTIGSRPDAELPRPVTRRRRFLGGIGGWILLGLAPLAGSLFTVAAIILILATGDGRGLPGLISVQRVTDDRTPRL